MSALFRPERYVRARDAAHAVAELAGAPGARVLAGGTLVMQGSDTTTRVLVDVTSAGLDYVKDAGDAWVIGAATPISRLVGAGLPGAIDDGARMVGAPALRGVGTLGGNLVGARGYGHLGPALLALDARARLLSPAGEREAPVGELWTGPLRPAELLTELRVPGGWRFSGAEQLERTALDHFVAYAVLAVPAAVGGSPRWAFGALGADPLLAVGDPAPASLAAIDDHNASAEYRRHVAGVLMERLRRRSGGGDG